MENSSLNRLSAELRNEIYELVLAQDKPLVICSEHPNPDSTAVQPPLTRVCRQIRAEALELFYYCNTFVIEMISSRLWDWDDYILWNFPYEPEYETWGEFEMPVPGTQCEILERRTYEVSEWLKCTDRKYHDVIKKAELLICMPEEHWEDRDWDGNLTDVYNWVPLTKTLRQCGYGGSGGQQRLKATVRLISEWDPEYLGLGYCERHKEDARKYFEDLCLEVAIAWDKLWSHEVSHCSHCRAPLHETQ